MTGEAGADDTSARRERLAVAGLLALVMALAWAFTIHQAKLMQDMDVAMQRDMAMSMNDMPASWTVVDIAVVFIMWAAMMVPGAGPMITAFATINRRRRQRSAPHVPTAIFLLGYLAIWSGFSLIATALQWLLQSRGLLTMVMESSSNYFSATLFIAAGLYQFSPFKEACLAYCRSPESFVLTEWRDGTIGAVVMGMRHGLFCLGCCGALMLLLFAVAVMDLRWVAALTVLVTAEKLLPGGKALRVGIGIVLILAGAGFALAPR
jgi:predicted metal-binding membrane protein